jgi:peptidoglycan/LPS O-acetylase OafA/YrhL
VTTTAARTGAKTAGPGTAGNARKRLDIEGLRAIAVVAVILDHLVAWPSGGFVGVDVFFVISGFLITALLLREHERTGTISFSGFYKRRIRRIMPASTLVLVVTVAVSYFLFNAGRFTATALDGLSALFFAGNWRFAATGTDYFQATAAPSPVQHFWSLAVEEQFYFVWPWLMLLIFALVGRRALGDHRRAHLVAGGVMLLLTVGSFAWATQESLNAPTLAYFSTFSRTWELGVGALLAVFAMNLLRINDAIRPYLAWAGLAGILASVFLINGELTFPAPWAALPVLSTALVIAAGTGGEQRGLAALRNPLMAYIGKISYSLYLWHFPVIIFCASLFREGSPIYYLAAAVGTLVLSVASFHLVEDPIRRSDWLTGLPRHQRQAKRRDRRRGNTEPRTTAQLVGVGLVGLVVAGLSVAALTPPPTNTTGNAGVSAAPGTAVEGSEAEDLTPEAELQQKVGAALASTSWPDFDPPIEDLGGQKAPQWEENDCIDVTSKNKALCVYGSEVAPKTMAVVGDSVATSWLPGIIAGVGEEYRIQALTKEGCAAGHADVTEPNGPKSRAWAACEDHHRWVEQQLVASPPDVILVGESYLSTSRLVSGATGAAASTEWRTGLDEALSAFPKSSRIVTLMGPPGSTDLRQCYSPVSKPADCVGTTTDVWTQMMNAEKASTEAVGGTFINTRSWFCAATKCTSFIESIPAYIDAFHLSRSYSERTGPVIREALTSVGAATPSP